MSGPLPTAAPPPLISIRDVPRPEHQPGPAPGPADQARSGPCSRSIRSLRPATHARGQPLGHSGVKLFHFTVGRNRNDHGLLGSGIVTVIVDEDGSTAWMGPARLRKLPLTISSASSDCPSALLEPRARS